MIEVKSILDADKFHCFCLVMGMNTRLYYRTDLTLEDILESDEVKGSVMSWILGFQVIMRYRRDGQPGNFAPSYCAPPSTPHCQQPSQSTKTL